ncbi:two component sensor histidine kinase [Neokomagataea thailandica NBRC 106555]|nr:two component sensor histidine kinase [Neokomagataea thailandica NBRC 106555]
MDSALEEIMRLEMQSAAHAMGDDLIASAEIARIRVVLVDPIQADAQHIDSVLRQHEFDVTSVTNGEEALAAIAEDRPDLVVMASALVGMTSSQLARSMHLDPNTRSIPILMLTGDASSVLEREGLQSGADAYISKSAHPDVMVLRLRALLREGPDLPRGDGLRKARIVIVQLPVDDDEGAELSEETSAPSSPSLGELLWRDGHTVTTIERSDNLIEGSWLQGADSPDCLVLELQGHQEDLKFCQLLDVRRQAVLSAGGVPFRTLGIIDAARFRDQSSVGFFEGGIDDLVPSDIAREALAMRIRTLAQRRMAQDDFRQQEIERQQSALILEAARGKAEMAEALAQANMELARANDQLIQTQAKLVQTAKMASLGELVAGIAHEINNPLAFTIAHADTVARVIVGLEHTQDQEDTRRLRNKATKRLESMKVGLQRIQSLVQRLRRFSHLDEGALQVIDVPAALGTVLDLLAHKIGHGIVVEKELEAPAKLICQAAFLNQAVMNVISNAADALREGVEEGAVASGRISIGSRLHAGRYEMWVKDDGPGLPEDIRVRVFDPFFTTKPVGTGTGLGLAIAYSVMQAHNGTIDIEDAHLPDGRGVGACFRLSMPVHETQEGLSAEGRTA